MGGSASKPNVTAGLERVNVSEVAPRSVSTRGVALSVAGGLFQVPHPPGTVCAMTLLEKLTVSVPSERVATDVPSAGIAADMLVVVSKYAVVGCEIARSSAACGIRGSPAS